MSSAAPARLIRGRVLRFLREPETPDDAAAWVYAPDGAVLVRDGRVAAIGDHAAVAPQAAPETVVDDLRPFLLIPGLIDPHLHFPQAQAVAAWGAQLLDWLERHVFPEEARFADPSHAQAVAPRFFDALLRRGTTTVCAFCSSHAASAEAFFAEAAARDMRVVGGQVMMDAHCPDGVRDTAQSAHDDTAALIGRWHGAGRAEVAISPRFALTSSPAQLQAAGALAAAHPSCLIQTHLSETRAEIARAAELYPQARDYAEIYDRFGLLGPRSLMGHCVHLTARETARMAEAGAVSVLCPTSNMFLGSGLANEAALRAAGVRRALASDIGAGPDWSMLPVMGAAYQTSQLVGGPPLDPMRALWLATLGNADALGMVDRIGTLAPGSEADLIALDPRATPELALRVERAESLADEVFALQMLGDDRAVKAVYLAGAPVAPPRE